MTEATGRAIRSATDSAAGGADGFDSRDGRQPAVAGRYRRRW